MLHKAQAKQSVEQAARQKEKHGGLAIDDGNGAIEIRGNSWIADRFAAGTAQDWRQSKQARGGPLHYVFIVEHIGPPQP